MLELKALLLWLTMVALAALQQCLQLEHPADRLLELKALLLWLTMVALAALQTSAAGPCRAGPSAFTGQTASDFAPGLLARLRWRADLVERFTPMFKFHPEVCTPSHHRPPASLHCDM